MRAVLLPAVMLLVACSPRFSDEDVKALRAPRRRRTAEIVIGQPNGILPDSLADAVIAFCLAGGLQLQRPGFEGKSHTMLVHVSQRIADQQRIASAIRKQVELWRAAEHQGQQLETVFRPVWDKIRGGVDAPANEGSIIATSGAVLRQLVILELNQRSWRKSGVRREAGSSHRGGRRQSPIPRSDP